MAQAGKGRLNYRCPSCFMRDLDIDMFYDAEKEEFYCIRCQYCGNEEDVLKKYEMVRVHVCTPARVLSPLNRSVEQVPKLVRDVIAGGI